MASKKCIAILTRGYSDPTRYFLLIKRNCFISNFLSDKTVPLLIFHEGNISDEQQAFIKSFSAELTIHFINVVGPHAFRKSKEGAVFDTVSSSWGIGYRHMCSFWFVDFWHFVKDYDMVLRIDEDCMINFNIDTVFQKLDSCMFISGMEQGDAEWVTKGMNDFTLQHIKEKYNTTVLSKSPSGPYTNIFAVNLASARKVDKLHTYIKAVDVYNRIYTYRWGDLPLWGEAIHYFCDPGALVVDTGIKYFHLSHNTDVNS
jgi:hypothetical protein